jgi:hypothetical protein
MFQTGLILRDRMGPSMGEIAPVVRQFLVAFAELRKATICFVMSFRLSVRPHGTSRLPRKGFSWNLIYEDFPKISRDILSFIKIGPEYRVLYMKTNINFLSYLAHFFSEWEMFQTKVVEKIETHILWSETFFLKSCRLWDNVEKYCRRGRPQMTVWRMRIAFWVPKATHTHTQVA